MYKLKIGITTLSLKTLYSTAIEVFIGRLKSIIIHFMNNFFPGLVIQGVVCQLNKRRLRQHTGLLPLGDFGTVRVN